MSFFRTQLEDWLKTIDVKANRVLDIGGGANPVKGRTRSWKVKEYMILDNEAERMRVKPDLTGDMNKHTAYHNVWPAWDVIFMLEVMEYIYMPYIALVNVFLMLAPNGIAYISFPFVYPWHEPKEIDYLRYTSQGVKKLLEVAGFSKWNIKPRIDKSGLLEQFYHADGMHPAKRERHDVTGWLVEAKK